MHSINPLDEAALKVQMRQMFNKVGWVGSYQCLYEMVRAAEILLEVLIEENIKETKR